MIDKSEILNYILGDVTINFLIAFYLFSILGVFLSMLLHYNDKVVKKKKGKFNFKFWLKDNLVRFLTSVLCIFILVRFYSLLPIKFELNMFLGVLTGTSLDRLIIFIRNRTNINIFQS